MTPHGNRLCPVLRATAILLAFAARMPAAEITIRPSPGGATVMIDGQLFTEYLVRSGTKPILWPILGPTGKPMTRAFPMSPQTEGTHDHPHHRSLWFTHGSVNGIDFWDESPANKVGTIRHRQFVLLKSGEEGILITRNDWLDPRGKKICEDQRRLAFAAEGSGRRIDFDITLAATEGPLQFGDTKEGTFGMRVADSLRVDAHQGGHLVNSQAQRDGEVWGKRAPWIDDYGPVDDHVVGIALLNHPSSYGFPTYLHARTYGLLAANPFGAQTFAGKEHAGVAYTLGAGGRLRLSYRVIFHLGDAKAAGIADVFAAYARQPRP
jgi:hypothetical protein